MRTRNVLWVVFVERRQTFYSEGRRGNASGDTVIEVERDSTVSDRFVPEKSEVSHAHAAMFANVQVPVWPGNLEILKLSLNIGEQIVRRCKSADQEYSLKRIVVSDGHKKKP
jgi:hypothetical protein